MLLKMNENHWIWNKRLGFQKRSTSLFFVGLSFSFPFSLFSFLLLNSTYRVVLWNLFRILVLCCIFNLITPIIEWSQLVPPSIFILLLYKLSRLSFASFKCVEFSPFLLRVHLPFFCLSFPPHLSLLSFGFSSFSNSRFIFRIWAPSALFSQRRSREWEQRWRRRWQQPNQWIAAPAAAAAAQRKVRGAVVLGPWH